MEQASKHIAKSSRKRNERDEGKKVTFSRVAFHATPL
jgi:hypothetical protein